MSQPNFEDIVGGFLQGSASDFNEMLDHLGAHSDEQRVAAMSLLQTGSEIAVAKIAGMNTSVAEGALRASYLNLQSVSSTQVAQATMKLIQHTIQRAIAATLAIVIGL